MLLGLGRIAEEYGLRVQSHLSENFEEIATVKELCPDCARYYETYERAGLFNINTVMAHCVHSDKGERDAMLKHGVWAAHCPIPIRIYIRV